MDKKHKDDLNSEHHITQTKENPPMNFCWLHDPTVMFNALLVVFTALLAIVGYLQWQTLKKTDETSRLRDRAYVYFLNPTLTPYPPNNPIVWGIGITLENAGNMPARRISIRFTYLDIKRSENIIDPFPLAKWSIVEVPNVIGPKQHFILHGSDIPISKIEAAKKSDIDLFILMEAEYIDGFDLDKSRITQMSRILRFDKYGGHSLGFAGPHNCTDDDCRYIQGQKKGN